METRFLTNDPLTRKRWAKDLFSVVLPAVEFNSLCGTGADSIIQIKTELGKGEGDQITFGIRLPLIADPVVGDKKVEGTEEQLRFRDFKMGIEEVNKAVDTGGKMDEQRVPYNLMQEGKDGLQEWYSAWLSDYAINALCGNSKFRVSGEVFADPITEPDADHFFTPGNVAEANLDATSIMDLTFLDAMKQAAEMGDPLNGLYRLRPLSLGGKSYYKVIMHNYVFDQLKANTNIGQWGDLLRCAHKLAEPQVEIEYNGMLIIKSVRNPLIRAIGTGGAGIYRTVLCGAQAACMAWGGAGESKSSVMAFVPYERDAKRFVMIRGGAILGIKKVGFPITKGGTDVRDYGVVTASSYGAKLSG
jgi:N4-gp56 family major capsid protein